MDKKDFSEDTTVLCKRCGQTQRISFRWCMMNLWPVCCNEGMHLEDTDANIMDEMRKVNSYTGFRKFSLQNS